MAELKWTGERLVTTLSNKFGVYEHLHRYALASNYIENKTVLDIASGEGYGTNLLSLKAKKIFGVDVSEEAIIHAKEKYKKDNLEYRLGSATNIPFDDNMFDVVVSFETIEHLVEQELMLSEIKRVLKDDGILILSSPEKRIYGIREPNNIYHLKELTLDELLKLIKYQFENCFIFKQLISVGSLIVPLETTKVSSFDMYDGDFYHIKNNFDESDTFNKPFFNILICSNSHIDENRYAISSMYNGHGAYEELITQSQIQLNKMTELEIQLDKMNSLFIIRVLRRLKRLFKIS